MGRVALIMLMNGKTKTKTLSPRLHLSPRASFSASVSFFPTHSLATGLKGRKDFFLSKQGRTRTKAACLSWGLCKHQGISSGRRSKISNIHILGICRRRGCWRWRVRNGREKAKVRGGGRWGGTSRDIPCSPWEGPHGNGFSWQKSEQRKGVRGNEWQREATMHWPVSLHPCPPALPGGVKSSEEVKLSQG